MSSEEIRLPERLPTDVCNVCDFVGLYRSTSNPEYLLLARKAAIELGHAGMMDVVESLDGKPMSYEEKFQALKHGIIQGRGYIFDFESSAGELYRQLFWDSEIDDVFLSNLPQYTKGITKNITDTLLASPSIDKADEAIFSAYRALFGSYLQHNIKHSIFDIKLVSLAKAVDGLENLENYADWIIHGCMNAGDFENANRIATEMQKAKTIDVEAMPVAPLQLPSSPSSIEYMKDKKPTSSL